MKLAIVIPVLNEAAVLGPALAALAPLRRRGSTVVVVDGGSDDGTLQHAAAADHVVPSARGRALQMNAGAKVALDAGADALLFLHADTQLPAEADKQVVRALATARWGRFDVRIEGCSRLLPWVALLMNWRSRATGICTGDQALFMQADFFRELGGFAAVALMEDVEWTRRARRRARPAALRAQVATSARRWEKHGVLRTIMLMWSFRLAFFFGADPAALARRYRDAR